MAKKPGSARAARPKGRSRFILAGALAIALLGGAGVLAKLLGGGGEVPPPTTADGRLVVMEFSDYG